VRRRGVATTTRVHGSLAAETKALANNLQRRSGGQASGDLSSPPGVAPCTSGAPRAAAGVRRAMGRVLLQPGPSVCSWEPRGERREKAPGEGARRDARCTAGSPAAGRGAPEPLGALADVLPIPASLSPDTAGVQGAAARSQHPHRSLVPRPWPRRASEHPQAVPPAKKGSGTGRAAAPSPATRCRAARPGARGSHDGAGGQRVADVAGAGGPAVLAEGLVAAAVGVAAPLDGVGGQRLGRQSVEDTGVDGQRRQPVVGEEDGLPLAGGAGDELVLGAGLVEDLQALLAHRVQAGEDAGPLVGEVVHVAAGGALEGLAGRRGVQHVLVDDDLVRRRLPVVADLRAALPLALVPALSPRQGGSPGQRQGAGGGIQGGDVPARLVDDDLGLGGPRALGHEGRLAARGRRVARLRGLQLRKLLRVDDLHRLHLNDDLLPFQTRHEYRFHITVHCSGVSEGRLHEAKTCRQPAELSVSVCPRSRSTGSSRRSGRASWGNGAEPAGPVPLFSPRVPGVRPGQDALGQAIRASAPRGASPGG